MGGLVLASDSLALSLALLESVPWPRRSILDSSDRGHGRDREFYEVLIEIITKPSSKLHKTMINCSYSFVRIDSQQLISMDYRPNRHQTYRFYRDCCFSFVPEVLLT